jgi:hypothetical protein
LNPFAGLIPETAPRIRRHPGIPVALSAGATARRAIVGFTGEFSQADVVAATAVSPREARRAIYHALSDGLIENVRRACPGKTAVYRPKPDEVHQVR